MTCTAVTKLLCVAAFEQRLISVVLCCAGLPCLPLTDAPLICGSPAHAVCSFGMQRTGPMWPREDIVPVQSGLQRGNQWKPVHTPTLQMWEQRKEKKKKEKCNLEAALRGRTQMSYRLLGQEVMRPRCGCSGVDLNQ
ncbi:uncharacterized protein V6R79_013851 [Siganus canaliculatus]